MADLPAPAPAVAPLFVSSWSQFAPLDSLRGQVGMAPASITWVANHAVYVPIALPFQYTVRRVFWVNGTTIGSNCDFGIYTAGGVRIYSVNNAGGTNAQSGTSAPQYNSPTLFVLVPGNYWFGYSCDGTTNRATGSTAVTAAAQRLSGVLQQGTAYPLPTSMGSAVAATQALYPLIGVTSTASGF